MIRNRWVGVFWFQLKQSDYCLTGVKPIQGPNEFIRRKQNCCILWIPGKNIEPFSAQGTGEVSLATDAGESAVGTAAVKEPPDTAVKSTEGTGEVSITTDADESAVGTAAANVEPEAEAKSVDEDTSVTEGTVFISSHCPKTCKVIQGWF